MNPRTLALGAALTAAALALSGCSGGESDTAASGPQTPTQAADPQGTEAPPNTGDESDLANYKPALSWDDAIAKAAEELDGSLTRVELRVQSDGPLQYDIEHREGDRAPTVSYDAETGKRIDTGSGRAEGKAEPLDLQAYVDLDRAKSSALDVQPGEIRTIRLSKPGKKAVYEFAISPEADAENYPVEVDAEAGTAVRED